MQLYSGADLQGDATVVSERSGLAALVEPAALGLPTLVGGGDASVLAPDSPSPSALACKENDRHKPDWTLLCTLGASHPCEYSEHPMHGTLVPMSSTDVSTLHAPLHALRISPRTGTRGG